MVNDHYNAFISYRHCEPDATIAGRIQKQLERFRIPSAIAKKTGMKRIERVFRDKEELPLCNNLSDDIETALNNSDYLILICSPRTKESMWVAREVELFLQNHSIDKVLTVLVEGEPQDVVPPILMDNREPLSCDYRISPSKAKRDELPRLASAILNCRYDELRQRQRQYQMRRRMVVLTALLVLALGLSAYFFYTTKQIEQHYDEQLRSQSNYLAAESLQRLEEGDRLTALELALYALEGDRPWVPEAEYALGCAVGAYTSDATLRAVQALEHSSAVMDFFITEDEKYLISWDQSYALYVRDMQDNTLLQRIPLPDRPVRVCQLPGNRVAVLAEKLLCYDYLTGQELWTSSTLAGDFVYENGLLVAEGIVDINTGKIDLLEDDLSLKTPLCISEDGNLIAFKVLGYADYRVLIYDRSKNAYTETDVCPNYIERAKFVGESLLLLCDFDLTALDESLSMLDFTMLRKSVRDFVRIDVKTGETRWHTELVHYLQSYCSFLCVQGDTAMVFLSNLCFTVNLENGEILQQAQFVDSIASVQERKNGIGCFLRNGHFAPAQPGMTETSSIRYFPENLSKGTLQGGNFILTDGANQIVRYAYVMDDALVIADTLPDATRLTLCDENGSYALFFSDYNSTVLCYRMQDEPALLWTQTLSDKCIGMSVTEAYFYDPSASQLIICALEDGTLRRQELLEKSGNGYTCIASEPILCADSVVFVRYEQTYDAAAGSVERLYLCTLSMDGSRSEQPLPEIASLEYTSVTRGTLTAADSALIITLMQSNEDWTAKTYAVLFFNPKTGEFRELKTFTAGNTFRNLAVYDDGRLLIADTDGVTVFNQNFEAIGTLSMPVPAFDAHFDGKQLLILDEEGTLYFCTADAAVEHKEALHYYEGKISDTAKVRWHSAKKSFAMQVGSICNILDVQSKTAFAYVPDCIFYQPKSARFYVSIPNEGYQLGYFPHYSTRELIEKAREILGDNEMSTEQKSRYGIE